jgi:glycosyltransferase involved in cell wall biosynthesis
MPTVLHVMPHWGGGGETYIDVLERLDGYRHDRAPLSATRSRSRGVVSVIERWPGIARRIQGADIVHAHGDTAAILASPMLWRRPSVITAQGLHRLRRVSGASAWTTVHAMRVAVGAATITACSANVERDELAAILPPRLRGRLVVVPNSVPLPQPRDPVRRARARDALGVGADDVVALYVGRFEVRKDPLVAIAAVESARARGAPLVLLVAGTGGPLEPEVWARASGGIRPLGHRDDVEVLYAAADLFVAPSRYEGMSFALLEAMSHGLVAVVSDGAGNTEAVGDAGVVFPVGDDARLADRLTRLATESAERARLGAAARERMGSELSAERFLARMRGLYEAVMRERSAAP